MPAAVFLALAIVSEVAATVSLRLSEGLSRPVPSIVVVAGYVAAFLLLSRALVAGIPLGVAYGIWAAAGVALVALIGWAFLGDGLTLVQIGGIALVIGGVLALELGAEHR